MKLSELTQIIQEESQVILKKDKAVINEGIVNKIIFKLVDKYIKTKYKAYFDALHNDPEYKEALLGLKNSIERIDQSAENYKIAREKSKASYDAYAKKYGKEAAAKIIDNLYAGKSYERWKPKY